MNGVIFLKDRELLGVTPVENVFIANFMPSAPEAAVKVYLYGLMLLSSSHSADEDIAAALGMSETDVRAAFSYWESAGIIRVIGEEPLQIMYLNVKEALSKGAVDTAGARYGEFVRRIQEAAGTRMISGAELKKMYDWLDVFGFEQDAAIELFRRCLETKGARTSVSYMDAVAKTLAGKSALTKEAVSEHFDEEELLKTGAARILKSWHMSRRPTEAELALYEKWTKAWGLTREVVDAALQKMTAAEKMTFAYLDSILKEWHETGRIDMNAVEEAAKREDMMIELTRQAFKRAGLASRPNGEQRRLISEYCLERHMNAEMILYAAELSNGDQRPFVRLKSILKDWSERGIGSLREAREYHERNGSRPSGRAAQVGRALNYIHGGRYTDEELKKLGISTGEEFYDDEE